jgi:hypothetical protein
MVHRNVVAGTPAYRKGGSAELNESLVERKESATDPEDVLAEAECSLDERRERRAELTHVHAESEEGSADPNHVMSEEEGCSDE